ncbi:MAG: hypothetical protein PHH85_14195 [Candidatus Methanoperedens sp.]|nr:hypothetical protein [Candidatus Methanoperedens sp.]
MNEDVSIAVEWNGGTVKGFRSKEDAERFISHICKKMAPDIKYSIYSIYNPNFPDRKNAIYSHIDGRIPR